MKSFGKDYVEGCFFDIVKDPFTLFTFLCSNRLLLLLMVNPGFSSMFSGSWLCAVDLLTEIGLELGSRAVKSRLWDLLRYQNLLVLYIILLVLGFFQCGNCKKNYKHYQSLQGHRKYDCGKNPTFFCHLCDYTAKRKHHLQSHHSTKHNLNKTISPKSALSYVFGEAFEK